MNADDHKEFLLSEFDALRKQMAQDIKQIGDLLRYALLSSAGLWAWGLSQRSNSSMDSRIVCFLPIPLTVGLLLQTEQVRKYVAQIGDYLRKMEAHFQLPEPLGWERQWYRNPKKAKIPLVERIIWYLLLGCNLSGFLWVLLTCGLGLGLGFRR